MIEIYILLTIIFLSFIGLIIYLIIKHEDKPSDNKRRRVNSIKINRYKPEPESVPDPEPEPESEQNMKCFIGKDCKGKRVKEIVCTKEDTISKEKWGHLTDSEDQVCTGNDIHVDKHFHLKDLDCHKARRYGNKYMICTDPKTPSEEHHPSEEEHHHITQRHHPSSEEHHHTTQRYHPLSEEHHQITPKHHPLSEEHRQITPKHHPSSEEQHPSSEEHHYITRNNVHIKPHNVLPNNMNHKTHAPYPL